MGFSTHIETGALGAAFDRWDAFHQARVQKAMLSATATGGRRLKSKLRERMQGARLGNLGNAFAATSDEERGRGVHHRPGGGFSASGLVYVRSGSERTRGALTAYTAGADIRPRNGKWLWVPSSDIQRLVGSKSERRRLTPALWRERGLESKIGPLTFIPSVNGYPLLVLKNVGTSLAGASRSVKSLRKNGQPRRGQRAREFVVAFIGIPWTSRQARVDVRAIHREVMAELPAILSRELRRA